MFGIGGSEILVILIVALLFLGPDKLPDAAKKLSKGIRDLKKQSRILQETIENDENIGGAIRDLKSALRGDELPVRPKIRTQPENTIAKPEDAKPAELEAGATPTADATHDADHPAPASPPAVTVSALAGEPDAEVPVSPNNDDLVGIIKPPIGEVAARETAKTEPAIVTEPEPVKKHG